jgi:hypothetical protein
MNDWKQIAGQPHLFRHKETGIVRTVNVLELAERVIALEARVVTLEAGNKLSEIEEHQEFVRQMVAAGGVPCECSWCTP